MTKHHLAVGTWTPPGAIFTFQFDDESLELKLIKKTEIPHDEPISWMTFSHDKRNIYGASMKQWSSHTVKNTVEIAHSISHPMTHDPKAAQDDTRTRAIFVLAARKPPYYVYCNPFYEHAGHGSIFSVDVSGNLEENIQNYEYSPDSAIHGMVFDPSESYLYSADMWGNQIWCHKKDADSGTLTLVGSVPAPKDHDQPRWVAIHPSGNYLYALMEHGNTLAVYLIDPKTHIPVYTQISFPLVPKFLVERSPKMYRGDVCTLTSSGKHLFATSRSNTAGISGYISAFQLTPKGTIKRQMCLSPTSTGGGHSNAVSPCDWSDEWLALTDDEQGFVEIYRWDGEWLARVAKCDVKEPGFGMNAIWFD